MITAWCATCNKTVESSDYVEGREEMDTVIAYCHGQIESRRVVGFLSEGGYGENITVTFFKGVKDAAAPDNV